MAAHDKLVVDQEEYEYASTQLYHSSSRHSGNTELIQRRQL
jgi:hypothetical protein